MLFHPQQSEITMKIDSFKYFVVCFISLSILFFALPGFADNGTLEVKCVESSGTPVQNAKIMIFNLVAQKEKDKKADSEGVAEFTKLEDGTYRVVGRKDGFSPALFEFVVLKGSKESVTLKFNAGADNKLYFEDPAEGQRAIAFLKQGIELLAQKKIADAEKPLSQSIEINPSNPVGFYYLSVAYLQQEKYDQLEPMLNKAIQVAGLMKALPPMDPSLPSNDQVYQGASKLLKQISGFKGDIALQKKNYDQAIKEYTEAIKSNPDNHEYYASLAIALANAKRFDEAITAMDKAVQLKPDEKAYVDNRAIIAAKKESATISKAQAIMEEGIKLLQSDDAAAAVKKFEEAKSMIAEGKQAPLWLQIGKAQAKLGQQDAAIAAFKKSIELAPEKTVADYRNAYAQFYLDERKYDEAIGILADPKAAGSQSPEQILLDLAKTWKNKEPNFAMAALEKAIQINPDSADVYFDLGQLCYMEGKTKDSRTKELLTKYLEIGKDPDKIQSAKDFLVIVNKRSSK
jgi:tetratricopeptide (TPR) repeat protein